MSALSKIARVIVLFSIVLPVMAAVDFGSFGLLFGLYSEAEIYVIFPTILLLICGLCFVARKLSKYLVPKAFLFTGTISTTCVVVAGMAAFNLFAFTKTFAFTTVYQDYRQQIAQIASVIVVDFFSTVVVYDALRVLYQLRAGQTNIKL